MYKRESNDEALLKQYKKKLKKFRSSYNNRLAMSYVPVAAGTAIGGTTGSIAGNMIGAKLAPKWTKKVAGVKVGANLIGRIAGGTLGASIGGRIGLPYAQKMATNRLLPSKKQLSYFAPKNKKEQKLLSTYLQDKNINSIVTSAKNLLPRKSDIANLLPSSQEKNSFLDTVKKNSLEYGAKRAIKSYNKK